jgi:hypothetical protein
MNPTITLAPDGRHVDVFVPITFKRFGGKKTIVATNSSTALPNSSKTTDKTIIKALARAWRWQKLLDDGMYATIAEMADKEQINRSYVSRTIRLALLAPDIIEAIVNGTQPQTLQLADLEGPFPVDWNQQRALFGFPGR